MRRSVSRLRFPRRKRKSGPARVVFGLLATVASLWILWANEGRINLADVAHSSVQADAAFVDPQLEGALIAVTDHLTTPESIGDDYYLRPGDYIQINRWVEMFAWVEEEESDDDGTDYTYELTWTDDPRPAEEFYWSAGHENPQLFIRNETITARTASVGGYRIDPRQIQLPRAGLLKLSFQNVREGPYRIGEEYIFEGEGSLEEPHLGDIRISFTAVPANMLVTAFGRQVGDEIHRFQRDDDVQLYRVLAGDRTQASGRLNTEYRNLLWGFRALGFLLMWLGLSLIVSPLTFLLEYVPVLGSLGRWALRGITLFLALVLSSLIILVSVIAHNVWALLVLLLLLVSGAYVWQQRRGVTQ